MFGCLLVRGCGVSWLVGLFYGFECFGAVAFVVVVSERLTVSAVLVVFGAVVAVVPAVAVVVGMQAKQKKRGRSVPPFPFLLSYSPFIFNDKIKQKTKIM